MGCWSSDLEFDWGSAAGRGWLGYSYIVNAYFVLEGEDELEILYVTEWAAGGKPKSSTRRKCPSVSTAYLCWETLEFDGSALGVEGDDELRRDGALARDSGLEVFNGREVGGVDLDGLPAVGYQHLGSWGCGHGPFSTVRARAVLALAVLQPGVSAQW